MRDTFLGGGVTGQCHQMSQGGGKELAKLSCDIFSKILNHIFVSFHVFSKEKRQVFF